jgi:hypothetical protein
VRAPALARLDVGGGLALPDRGKGFSDIRFINQVGVLST